MASTYVNGTKVATGTTDPYDFSNVDATFAASGKTWTGLLAELRVYNCCLTANQLTLLLGQMKAKWGTL